MDIYTIIYFIQFERTIENTSEIVSIPYDIINIIKKYINWWHYLNGYTVENLKSIINLYVSIEPYKRNNEFINKKISTYFLSNFTIFNINEFENIGNKVLYGNTIPNKGEKYGITKPLNEINENVYEILNEYSKKRYRRGIRILKRQKLIEIINDFSIPIIHLYRYDNEYILSKKFPKISYKITSKKIELKNYYNDIKSINIKDKIKFNIYNYEYRENERKIQYTIEKIGKTIKFTNDIKINTYKFIYSYLMTYIKNQI